MGLKGLFAALGSVALVTVALAGHTQADNALKSEGPGTSRYLAVWAGDEDGKDADFLAIIDADPASKTYGRVVNTAPVPAVPGAHLLAVTGFGNTPKDFPSSRLNEAHHMSEKLTPDKKLFTGGLISGNIFSFDLNDPLNIPKPKLVVTYTAGSKFSAPDDIYPLSGGNMIATFMGSGGPTVPPALTTPGGLLEFTPDGKIVAEHEAAVKNGPAHYRTGEDTGLLANPHGISVREDLNVLVTSDFADPVSLATADFSEGKQKFRSTVRVWDLKERKVRKVVQVPDGPRKEKRPVDEEPEGLMMVRLLNKPGHKGAFTASMNGGALYYCPDIAAKEPVFTQVYDFGAGAGVSVFSITDDDKYLILPISGIKSPEDEGFDPKSHARRIVQLDITGLLEAGKGFKCSPSRPDSPDCPRLASELNADSDLNFSTRGGPHVLALEPGGARLAYVNYFVDLNHGFGLPGTGSCGDHRLFMVKRIGEGLQIDTSFKDEFDGRPGVNFNRAKWSHGETGNAKPHGLVFLE